MSRLHDLALLDMEHNEQIVEIFKCLMQNAMEYAKLSYEYLTSDNIENSIAISYLQIASSKFSSAEVFYYSHTDLARIEVNVIFDKFDHYVFDVLQNERLCKLENHPVQSFNNLCKAFDNSPIC